MKCETIEKWWLLRDSGELRGWRRRAAERHAASCPRCAAFASSLAGWRRDVAETRVDARPADWVRTSILNTATVAARARHAARPEPRAIPWAPALAAAAAAFALVLGGLVAAHRFASAARDGGAPSVAGAAAASVDDAIERLAAKMEDLSGEILGSSGSAAADDDLDDMATELLKLEGARI